MLKRMSSLAVLGAMVVSAVAEARPMIPPPNQMGSVRMSASQMLKDSVALLDLLESNGTGLATADAVDLEAAAHDFYSVVGYYMGLGNAYMGPGPSRSDREVAEKFMALQTESMQAAVAVSRAQEGPRASQLVRGITDSVKALHEQFSPWNPVRGDAARISRSSRDAYNLAATTFGDIERRPDLDPQTRARMRLALQGLLDLQPKVQELERLTRSGLNPGAEPDMNSVRGSMETVELASKIARARLSRLPYNMMHLDAVDMNLQRMGADLMNVQN